MTALPRRKYPWGVKDENPTPELLSEPILDTTYKTSSSCSASFEPGTSIGFQQKPSRFRGMGVSPINQTPNRPADEVNATRIAKIEIKRDLGL